MTVDVALFAYLSRYHPDGQGGRHARAFTVEPGTTVGDMIASLSLPDEPRIVFVNGRHAADEHILSEGDRMAVFPPVAGG